MSNCITLKIAPVQPVLQLVLDPVPKEATTEVAKALVGAKGDKGEPGSSGTGFNYTQASAESTWTVNHNMGFKPAVDVFTVGGEQVNAEVFHPSVNQTIIQFNVPMAGSARLA